MTIDAICNGIVIDHIPAGQGMELYRLLGLSSLNCQIAVIQNAPSKKMGTKDFIKVAAPMDLDMDLLGYFAPDATVNIIRDGALVEKKKMALPETLTNVIFCKNPRCITTTEQELPHVFRLTDADKRTYRCIYCEAQPDGK
jgi:aspartate carbamoyltransferase regulatory subunit